MSMTALAILEIPSNNFGVFQKLLSKHIIKNNIKVCEKKKTNVEEATEKHIAIEMYKQEYRCAD